MDPDVREVAHVQIHKMGELAILRDASRFVNTSDRVSQNESEVLRKS